MHSLRMPYLEDMSCMVVGRKFFRFWTDVCEVGAPPNDHFCFPSFSLWPCRFVDKRPTLCYASMITVYMISALQSDDWCQNHSLSSEIMSFFWCLTGLSHTISNSIFHTASWSSSGFGGICKPPAPTHKFKPWNVSNMQVIVMSPVPVPYKRPALLWDVVIHP